MKFIYELKHIKLSKIMEIFFEIIESHFILVDLDIFKAILYLIQANVLV